MTPTTTFSNAGLIPLAAITTMGVNVKEGDNPIGFFGTGLKYAIASLLRMDHEITIWRGLERLDFRAERDSVRGKDFDFIVMEQDSPVMASGRTSARLGFTTHLGAKWEMWQVFRELYSNCLDEEGELALGAVEPRADATTIQVRGSGFAAVARQKEKYFLASEPIHVRPNYVSVHPGRSDSLYYRGVMVAKLQHPSVHTYNILGEIELTEDRTLKNSYMGEYYVRAMLNRCEDRAVLEPVFVTQGAIYERNMYFDSVSQAFAEIVMELCEARGITAIHDGARQAAEHFMQREARVPVATLSAYERAELDAAKAFLATIGYEIKAPITVTETLGPGVAGMAKNNRIYITKNTIARGANYLIGTLLEEHLHLTHGFEDESRGFQDHLVDLVVKFAREAMFNKGTQR